ncbi:MAG TPA: nuclear transport factor 2 family protein [Saprospiraceae bacterium]|nr:nuclear transport factor 2 family protein [Saprospiraceae bacterium]HPN71094.1 nuclear transport factor 2 family protein [Saprospiraceae bacterium]
MQLIKSALQSFILGGDNTDIALLEKVIHPQFQNIQDGFFGKKGIYVFDKTDYINLVRNKTFGGKPRTINFISIEEQENIAIAKLELESLDLKFCSTIICVCEDGHWQIINNTVRVE